MTIPRRLVRTVPHETSDQVETWWAHACNLHPDWDHITLRDPLDPARFPRSGGVWSLAASGAQKAGLVRLEFLEAHGGHYFDSDVELFRSLEPLCDCRAYAAWEDLAVVPDAVLGAEAGHPAITACLDLALERITSNEIDWRTGNGAWATGPGVTTTILPHRSDVTLLPRSSFYPYGYWEKSRAGEDFAVNPDTFGVHRWAGSWITKS